MSILNKNFLYMSILVSSNYIFPLLIFPYISRVLGVDNIGLCNFIDGFINYFLLLAMIGVGTFGIREIAKVKDDRIKLDKVFSSLFILNIISTLLIVVILLILTFLIPSLYENKILVYIGILKILSTTFLLDWLFKGLENFKYITIRALIIKCLYVISVFVFVRKSEDYYIYFLLTSLLITFNSVCNCSYARKFVSF